MDPTATDVDQQELVQQLLAQAMRADAILHKGMTYVLSIQKRMHCVP